MKQTLFILGFAVAALAGAAQVSAHHGGAAFDQNQTLTFKGTVTEMTFTNPHVLVYWDVTKDGTTEKWSGWLTAPTKLARAGWTKTTLKPGDRDRSERDAAQGRHPHPPDPEAGGARRQGPPPVGELIGGRGCGRP